MKWLYERENRVIKVIIGQHINFTLVYLKAVATVQGSGYSFKKTWLQFKKWPICQRVPQLMRISLKLRYLCPYDIRNGTLETCSKRTDT